MAAPGSSAPEWQLQGLPPKPNTKISNTFQSEMGAEWRADSPWRPTPGDLTHGVPPLATYPQRPKRPLPAAHPW